MAGVNATMDPDLNVKDLKMNSPLDALPHSEESASADADFDLTKLRLRQDFDSAVRIKTAISTVTVRKPRGQEWFRVRPGEDWRFPTRVINLKDEQEIYLVHPDLIPAIIDEIQPVILFTTVNSLHEAFLWPVRLPKADGRTDKYMDGDLMAAKTAESKWTRRFWVQQTKSHKILAAEGNGEPIWPNLTFQRLIELAFKDRYITRLDHPVLKRLRGDQ
jgi:hypothetical protein